MSYDRLRAVDEQGNPVPGGYSNLIGLHTTGYYYRGSDNNTDYTLTADLTSQLTKTWQIKAGGDFTYYNLDRFQEAKAFNAIEAKTYNPYEGNLYAQTKLEFKGLIMNLGLRYDFYNPNDVVYLDPFDPFDIYRSQLEEREPDPQVRDTKTFGQFSPRLGISHPISEKTVLHFSYGHFFQRSTFGDYGEGTQVSGILNTYLVNDQTPIPYNLGNRELSPRKTVAYEVGIEHNIGGVVANVTAFYKDITKTVRSVTVFTLSGGRYLTSGNGDYGDAKGVEISLRKPLSGYWGGYFNYVWSTGIYGRSGDPDVIAPPNSNIQVGTVYDIGDFIAYDPPRLKLGMTLATPAGFEPLFGILSNIQLSFDYQVYYPHERIASNVFAEAGKQYLRYADKNANIRLRKEFDLLGVKPALFIEVRNAFNNTNENIDAVKSSPAEDRAKFINSGFSVFPSTQTDGSPFPDVITYRNLPRRVFIGASIGF
jgi:outer membrane receptor protein involved in Fe transport